MGLEEVRIIQTLKFQGGEAPSTFVPGIVPNPSLYPISYLWQNEVGICLFRFLRNSTEYEQQLLLKMTMSVGKSVFL